MSTENQESSSKQSLDAVLKEARAILVEIEKLRSRITEQTQEATQTLKLIQPFFDAAQTGTKEVYDSRIQISQALKRSETEAANCTEHAARLGELIKDLVKLKGQSEEELKASEIARKKADGEALYAFQAKINTELHANAVATYKGQAESEFATITLSRQKSEEILQLMTAKKVSAEGDAISINGTKKEINQATETLLKAAIEGSSQIKQVEESKIKINEIEKESVKLRDSIIQTRNSMDQALSETERSSSGVKGLVAEIAEEHRLSITHANKIKELLENSVKNDETLSNVLVHLKKSDEIASNHEQRVGKLGGELELLTKKVEALLPGATSAGLASAFNTQRIRFKEPQKRWIMTFLACMALLVGVSLPSFVKAAIGSGDSKWNEILIGLTMRLPIVLPLVWLAIYAGRNYMLSARLEEEYAHKEAISRSFEGYKREMEKITAGDANNPTPLASLCANILEAIAERPGRIYETKHEDVTILNEMRNAAQKADEFRKFKIAIP